MYDNLRPLSGLNSGQVQAGSDRVQQEPDRTCPGSALARTCPNLPEPVHPNPPALEALEVQNVT